MMTTLNIADASWLARSDTQQLYAALNRDGFETRFVGGAVRNSLLGLKISDIDLATTARPRQIIELAAKAGLKSIPSGIQHGTVTVLVANRSFEVTTLRADIKTDGRHAMVEFTDDWAVDAARRDFTMNALYASGDGRVFDPLGGYSDLASGLVRFIGRADARIAEDYLRILRFFRFNAQYGRGAFDADGLTACVRGREGLARLSGERVGGELIKLLGAGGALAAIEKMFGYGLLVPVLGSAPKLTGLANLIALETQLDIEPEAVRRLGALGVMTGAQGRVMANRLRLSKIERRRLELVGRATRHVDPFMSRKTARALLYRHGPQGYCDLLLLSAASLRPDEFVQLHDSLFELVHLPERWEIPELPVSGKDLLARGMAPGQAVGKTLRRLENHWIASDFQSGRDELAALVQKIKPQD